MATLRNKRKVAAVSRETRECRRNSQSQNSSALGVTEGYIAQVSEEIEEKGMRDKTANFGVGQNNRF